MYVGWGGGGGGGGGLGVGVGGWGLESFVCLVTFDPVNHLEQVPIL